MLQAMNTGHDGSMTTVHANSPRDAIARIETMALMANLNLPEKAVRRQIASAVQLIVQIVAFYRWLTPRDPCHRNQRHGRRSREPAGRFCVRQAGNIAGWAGAWRFYCDRSAAQFLRAIERFGNQCSGVMV